MQKIIQAKNLVYKVKEKEILKQVSFDINEGDFCCVVGMNGSGKSTLLKNICRAITPSSGEILIDNQPINSYSIKSLSQKMAVVFQSDDINLDFCAMQIVLMGRTPYQRLLQKDTPSDIQKAQQAMQLTNTIHLKDRQFPTLSGGEKQRVLIARALCQDTPIILLDEPIASLDLKHQVEIMQLLKRINLEQGKTIFIILHDLSLALQFSSHILAMKQGALTHFGPTNEVLTEENIQEIFDIKTKIISNNIILN